MAACEPGIVVGVYRQRGRAISGRGYMRRVRLERWRMQRRCHSASSHYSVRDFETRLGTDRGFLQGAKRTEFCLGKNIFLVWPVRASFAAGRLRGAVAPAGRTSILFGWFAGSGFYARERDRKSV